MRWDSSVRTHEYEPLGKTDQQTAEANVRRPQTSRHQHRPPFSRRHKAAELFSEHLDDGGGGAGGGEEFAEEEEAGDTTNLLIDEQRSTTRLQRDHFTRLDNRSQSIPSAAGSFPPSNKAASQHYRSKSTGLTNLSMVKEV